MGRELKRRADRVATQERLDMKWSTRQPKTPGVYVRAHDDGRLVGAYNMTGTAIDPQGGGLWLGPLPQIPREMLTPDDDDGCPMCGH